MTTIKERRAESFEDLCGRFLRAGCDVSAGVAGCKDGLRSLVVATINGSADPVRMMQTMIATLLESGEPDRLEDAIDVLAGVGSGLLALTSGPGALSSKPRDDYWYIVVSAISKIPQTHATVMWLYGALCGPDPALYSTVREALINNED